MANVLTNLSNIIIPLFFFYIIAYGLIHKKSIYDDFVHGAKNGARIVVEIMPTLIGLMVAVGILRASGFFAMLTKLFGFLNKYAGIPSEIVPLIIVRLFSASAATGIVLDLFQTYGTDSFIGLMASIMMSSTETVFYTMSVYCMAVKVTKTRWTLPGALLATAAGMAASVVLAGWM